jgi:hypothetical protein
MVQDMAEIIDLSEYRSARRAEHKKKMEAFRELIQRARALGRDRLADLFEQQMKETTNVS